MIRSHENALEEQTQLEGQIATSVQQGTQVATDTVYADVYIQFSSETSRVSDDIKAVEFHYRDGVDWRPLDPESGAGGDADRGKAT